MSHHHHHHHHLDVCITDVDAKSNRSKAPDKALAACRGKKKDTMMHASRAVRRAIKNGWTPTWISRGATKMSRFSLLESMEADIGK
jgi:hypothetical protein